MLNTLKEIEKENGKDKGITLQMVTKYYNKPVKRWESNKMGREIKLLYNSGYLRRNYKPLLKSYEYFIL